MSGCTKDKEGYFLDDWEIVYGNQFNRSLALFDSDGVAIPMGQITAIAVELFLTKDFTGTPWSTMDSNWQNEDPETGVIELIMEEAVVNALEPDKDFAFGRVVLTDAASGDVTYVQADVTFTNFSTDAVT